MIDRAHMRRVPFPQMSRAVELRNGCFPFNPGLALSCGPDDRTKTMKVRNSLKSLRARHRDNQIVRRRGRVYVINKTQRRFKARQG